MRGRQITESLSEVSVLLSIQGNLCTYCYKILHDPIDYLRLCVFVGTEGKLRRVSESLSEDPDCGDGEDGDDWLADVSSLTSTTIAAA